MPDGASLGPSRSARHPVTGTKQIGGVTPIRASHGPRRVSLTRRTDRASHRLHGASEMALTRACSAREAQLEGRKPIACVGSTRLPPPYLPVVENWSPPGHGACHDPKP